MRQILTFLLFTGLGYAAGNWTDINPIDEAFFAWFASFALVIGLYGSVVGIDLAAIRTYRTLALVVITVAVPLQILATGATFYLIHPAAISFLVAVAITQIDPLSVDTLLRDKGKMTTEAKAVLRVWASFDDPVTVLFGFLILVPILSDVSIGTSIGTYALYLAINLAPALILWVLHQKTTVLQNRTATLILLLMTLTVAFLAQAYLLAGLTGFILRPIPEKYLSRAIYILYHAIVFIVGMAIFTVGVDLRLGILLAGVIYFVIQPLTSIIVFYGTPNDLLHIAFSHQNGLTTLLMGIAFESLDFRVLPILLPAIVAVNLMNLIVNKIYAYKEQIGMIKT